MSETDFSVRADRGDASFVLPDKVVFVGLLSWLKGTPARVRRCPDPKSPWVFRCRAAKIVKSLRFVRPIRWFFAEEATEIIKNP